MCPNESIPYSEETEDVNQAIICPVCGNSVVNTPTEDLFSVDHVESDFRIRTLEEDVLDSWLVYCPYCFYITHDFEHVPKNLDLVQAYVQSAEYTDLLEDNTPTTLERFIVYLSILKVAKVSSFMMADTYLKISWLFEDDNDTENAIFYREKAVTHFGRSLLEQELSNKDSSMVFYYIAELSRRNKDFVRAKKSLLKMDTGITMFKHLFDFQAKLISKKDFSSAKMPHKEVNHDD